MKHDGQKIRDLRQIRGMTQEKLALLSKVSERTVQRAENGQPMAIETLNDLAAALEIPVSDLVAENVAGKDTATILRRVTSARTFIDELGKAGVALFDCDVDPSKEEIEHVLALVEAVEQRLPVPWDVNMRPEPLSLRQKIELSVKVTDLLSEVENFGIGLFTAASWIRARYPYYDSDEGVTATYSRQRFESVMTLRIRLSRTANDRTFDAGVISWGLEEEPVPVRATDPFDISDDDDVPF
jgi:transcriptional regulator with XRE-family HTH domain